MPRRLESVPPTDERRLPRRAFGLTLLAAGPARAQDASSAAVTLLVGGAPGSGPDRWARAFAPFLERHWPRTVITLRNHPGKGGLTAARLLAEAPPDGRLIGAVSTPQLLARAVETGVAALPGRLRFLAAVAEEPVVLVGHPGSLPDLAALRALGPQALLGTPPPGSAAHLAALALGDAWPLDLLAFATAVAARQAVAAGNIPAAMLAAPEAITAIRDGRLVVLGTAGERRSQLLPEAPTLGEQGLPLRLTAMRGFVLPAGTAEAVLAPLAAALRAVVADPEFAAQAEAEGLVPRFLGEAAWEPMLRQALAALERRWRAQPWVARRD